MRKIIHVDMDAFYASVEAGDDPSLHGKPILVGGSPEQRGVVASASYAARAFGIRSAMPMRTALRLCPQASVIRPRMSRYREVSEQLQAIYLSHTPLVEPVALDECYLDVTDHLVKVATATGVAVAIKQEIRERTGLTASAGVAPNKFLAKIASGLNKPDGLLVVKPGQIPSFLLTLPVNKLWGVGPVNERKLHSMGFPTVGSLERASQGQLIEVFGKFGQTLYNLSRGIDERPVVPDREPQQISAEITFDTDVDEVTALLEEIVRQATLIERRMAHYDKRGRTVTLKVRYDDFTGVTRSHTGTTMLSKANEIVETAHHLLEKTQVGVRRVRLIGIGVSNFEVPEAVQQKLPFPEDVFVGSDRLVR